MVFRHSVNVGSMVGTLRGGGDLLQLNLFDPFELRNSGEPKTSSSSPSRPKSHFVKLSQHFIDLRHGDLIC